MTIIGLVVFIVVLGLVAWLVNTYLPIPAVFKSVITVILIIVALLVTLQAFGLLGSMGDVPHLK